MANAKVEVAVQVAQRWMSQSKTRLRPGARLRNRRFFSLADVNAAIRRLADELNMRLMRGYGACRDGRAVADHRVPRLFEALAIAKGDGRHARLLKSIAKIDVLILDDWGLGILAPTERRDLLEILEDRHGRGSTIVTSQLPVDHWHEAIGDPTLADAILDRLVHNAHRLPLSGESLRRRANVTKPLDQTGQA